MSRLLAPPPIPGIPGPPEPPVIGSLIPFARDALGFLRRCQREYGDLVQLSLTNHRILLVSDPQLLVTEWRNLHRRRPGAQTAVAQRLPQPRPT